MNYVSNKSIQLNTFMKNDTSAYKINIIKIFKWYFLFYLQKEKNHYVDHFITAAGIILCKCPANE